MENKNTIELNVVRLGGGNGGSQPTKLSELENDSGFVESTSLGTAAYKNVEDLQVESISNYIPSGKYTFKNNGVSLTPLIKLKNNIAKSFIVEISGNNVANENNLPSTYYIELFHGSGTAYNTSNFDVHRNSRLYLKGELLFISENNFGDLVPTYKISFSNINNSTGKSIVEEFIISLEPDFINSGINTMLVTEGATDGWFTFTREAGPDLS